VLFFSYCQLEESQASREGGLARQPPTERKES